MIRRTTRTTPRGAAIPLKTREEARRSRCQICRVRYGGIVYTGHKKIWIPRQNFDHVIPVRWIRYLYPSLNPNDLENVLSVCHRENLAKKGAEDRLFVADVLGFVQRLNQLGWTDHLRRAATHFGIQEIVRLLP